MVHPVREQYERTIKQRRRDTFMEIVKKNFQEGDLHIICTHLSTETSTASAKRRIQNFTRAVLFGMRSEGYSTEKAAWVSLTEIRYGKDSTTLKRAEQIRHHVLMRGVPQAMWPELEYLWHSGSCIAEPIRGSIDTLAAQLANEGMGVYIKSKGIEGGD